MAMRRSFSRHFRILRGAWGCARLLLTVGLLGGAVYATPIVTFNDADLDGSKYLTGTNSVQLSKSATSAIVKSTAVSTQHWEDANSTALPDGCLFTAGCGTTLKVPEPQSLVLVGSGLLSMAELIRRRLIR